MIKFVIPGRGEYRLEYLILDVNGTLAMDGRLIDGVDERLRVLRERVKIHLLTAGTFGVMREVEETLGLSATRISGGAAKTAFVKQVGAASVIAVGNGTCDAGMLAAAALGIAVVGPEGLAREALESADVVAPDIFTALDLPLHPKRLVATLRC